MVSNRKSSSKIITFDDAAEIYRGESFVQVRKARFWIFITILCLIAAQSVNVYFLSLEHVSILKIVPINVISLAAISLSAGLARFHNVIAEKRTVEELKFYTSHISNDAVNKSKKAGSSKPRPSPARR